MTVIQSRLIALAFAFIATLGLFLVKPAATAIAPTPVSNDNLAQTEIRTAYEIQRKPYQLVDIWDAAVADLTQIVYDFVEAMRISLWQHGELHGARHVVITQPDASGTRYRYFYTPVYANNHIGLLTGLPQLMLEPHQTSLVLWKLKAHVHTGMGELVRIYRLVDNGMNWREHLTPLEEVIRIPV